AMASIECGREIAAALQILRKLPAHQGQKANWAPDHLIQMRTALKGLKLSAAEDGPAGTLDTEFGSVDELAGDKVKLLQQAFDTVHRHLREKKKKDKVLDFIDLELYAAEILQDERARAYYAKRWKAFLVDEFQDTNPLQAEIIRLLSQNALLTVVGDEKQSIY